MDRNTLINILQTHKNIKLKINGDISKIQNSEIFLDVYISPILTEEEKEKIKAEKIRQEMHKKAILEEQRREFEASCKGNYW